MDNRQAAYKYINEYQKKKYDRITILRKSGEKERLAKIASEHGYRTVTEFINACIDEKINSFEMPGTPAQAPISPVEAVRPEKAKYLPLTPENIEKIDFVMLTTYPPYQGDVFDKFGLEGFNKLIELAKEKQANKQLAPSPEP